MLKIADVSYPNTALFLESAIQVAQFYGFVPIEEATPSYEDELPEGTCRIETDKLTFIRREEKELVPLVHACADKKLNLSSKPLFIWRLGKPMRSAGSQYATLELHIIGMKNAAAEALLLAVTNAIAEGAGIERKVVCLNSIGSPDSSARYTRDLSHYLRKHASDLPLSVQGKVIHDPLGALAYILENNHPAAERAPVSIEYLNEEERRHFWDVLEYLESANLYYELSPRVIGSRDFWAHTLFDVCKIDSENEQLVPFARGGRYDTIVSRCAPNCVGAVGITIMCEMHGRSDVRPQRQGRGIQIYFAHLGLEARRKSIPILEVLRQAGIPVYQSLAYEHIKDQMDEAKLLRVPYILIMGHKEATEGTILIRETTTNSQYPVEIDELPRYLRRYKLIHA